MKHYSILDVTPTTDSWVADYINPATQILKKHGGRYLARTTSHEQLEGKSEKAALRILIEWPNKQAAMDFMNDPEYIPHLNARTAGSVSHHYLVEAKDDLI
ncbi:MAG: DUF1330 domain-containing protein [Bacteroidota bacterium]